MKILFYDTKKYDKDSFDAILNEYPEVLQMHGFYLEEASAVITFDVILDFDAPDRRKIYQDICRKVQERFPEYQIHVALDYDISD